jgi:T4 RnlA family RNA ligase
LIVFYFDYDRIIKKGKYMFAKKTYQELIDLAKKNEAFFYKDFQLNNQIYRLFNYRLASWTDFQEPSALNCRGIMYNVTNEENPLLVSLAPEKFFNYEEGGIDHTQYRFGDKMVKMDGSLISTYLHEDELYLKTKGSLFSEQALAAMKLLDKDQVFKTELKNLVAKGYTVNLEYTSPENRIVVPYQDENLTVLSMRNHSDGKTLFATKLKQFLKENNYHNILKNLVEYETVQSHDMTHAAFVESIRNEQEGEGYVTEIIVDESYSYLTKIKNIKYVTLHQAKDSVNSPMRLFEAVIEESTDDLRSLFSNDPYVLDKITEMEQHVQPIYNHLIKKVENFYQQNKSLDRKSYAIKAQEEGRELLGLKMNLYLNKPVNFKEFAKKHAKDMFGIKDILPEDIEEQVSKMKI